MKAYKNEPFLKLVLRFGLMFLISIFFIEIIFSIIINQSFTAMLQQYFFNNNWISFLKRLSVMSLLYGLFMAGYYKFIKK